MVVEKSYGSGNIGIFIASYIYGFSHTGVVIVSDSSRSAKIRTVTVPNIAQRRGQ
jgi:hypothetical protein